MALYSSCLLLLPLAAPCYLLYSLFKISTNPLNAIPGPWWAKFTDLPGTVATFSRKQVQFYHKLHQQYGPYVRVGPGQVFVSDVQAFKSIHKIGGHFQKADYYHFFGPTEAGEPPYGLFQMTDEADHAERRKLLARGFTAASLRNEWDDMVRDKVSLAIECMQKATAQAGGEVDVLKWWVLMASDVVSRVMFGESFDALKTGEPDPWFELIPKLNSASFLALSLPWVHAIAKRLPFLGSMEMFHAHTLLLAKGQTAVANSKRTMGSKSVNLFAKVHRQAEGNERKLTDDDICVEAASFMIAGTDTTSNTLTYLVWAILSHPEVQHALEQELGDLTEPLMDKELEQLPILSATIKETLRLYGAVPTPLPRIVPAGGVELGGYHFPEGTNLATQSFTTHRDPKAFNDPETFDYTRWLPSGECKTSDLAKAAFTPFGQGSRVCIGKHLAYMELRYGVAMFFRKFKGARLAPSTTPESMEMENLMLIEPKGKACRVILPSPKIGG